MSRGLEDFAIGNLEEKLGVTFERKGFWRSVKSFLGEQAQEMPSFHRVPDAWIMVKNPTPWKWSPIHEDISREFPFFIAVEVEDTSPLTKEKLRDYADLWFDLDCEDVCGFALLVADRYGTTFKFLDPCSAWHSLCLGTKTS